MKKLLFILPVLTTLASAQSVTIVPNAGVFNEALKINKSGFGLDHRTPNNLVGIGTYVNSLFGILQTHTNHPLAFTTNNATVQAILSTNGYFGLGGITDPQYFLDVNGRTRIRHNGNTAGIWFSKTNNAADQGAFLGNISDNQTGIWIGNAWRFGVNETGSVQIHGLAGTGERPVYADANGNLKTLKTHTISVSPNQFQPYTNDNTQGIFQTQMGTGQCLMSDGSQLPLFAALNLPDGATLVSAKVYYANTNSSKKFNLTIARTVLNGITSNGLFSGNTVSLSSSYLNIQSFNIPVENASMLTIDNTNYNYYVSVTPVNNAGGSASWSNNASSFMGIRGIVITYTY